MIEQSVYAPVCRAVVCEDRAEVVRGFEIDLTDDFCLHFNKLPAITQEARLRAEVISISGEAKLDELILERKPPQHESDDTRRKELAEAAKACQKADRRQSRCQERVESAEQLLQSYHHRATHLLWSEGQPFDFEAFKQFEQQLDEAQAELFEAKQVCSQAQERLKNAQAALLPQNKPETSDCEATMRLSMIRPGRIRIELYSVLPCALWRPAHEAHLKSDGSVHWTTRATVWQNTGEDWQNVELKLSTARTGSRSELPQIESDFVKMREKADKHQVKLVSRNEARAKDASSNAPVDQGVYDGGEARSFTVAGQHQLPSNGLPHTFEISQFESQATAKLIATPELSKNAIIVASFINNDRAPLLAGPVTLLYHGAQVGQGHIPYVDRGEKLSLGFGSDDRIAIDYRRSVKTEERMLQKDRRHFVQQVDLFNMGSSPIDLELCMRIPQSEFAGLTVQWSEEPPVKPDKDGQLRFTLPLAPQSRQTSTLSFYFEQSKDVQLPDPW